MKKIIIAIALMAVAAFSANAQKISMAVEGSFGKGTQFIVMDGGVNFVAGYKINNALEFGIGAGAQYAEALYGHETYSVKRLDKDSKTSEATYNNDQVIVPVFVRAKYVFDGVNLSSSGRLQPYVAIDGGYAVNVYGTAVESRITKVVDQSTKGKGLQGLFYLPQIGLDSDRLYVSVGLQGQAIKQLEVVTKVTEYDDNGYNIENVQQDYNVYDNFAQAITFKVGFKF